VGRIMKYILDAQKLQAFLARMDPIVRGVTIMDLSIKLAIGVNETDWAEPIPKPTSKAALGPYTETFEKFWSLYPKNRRSGKGGGVQGLEGNLQEGGRLRQHHHRPRVAGKAVRLDKGEQQVRAPARNLFEQKTMGRRTTGRNRIKKRAVFRPKWNLERKITHLEE